MKRQLVSALLVCVASCAYAKKTKTTEKVVEKVSTWTFPVEARSGATLTGTVTLSQEGKNVTVRVDVDKAPAGVHAVHLHETPDCSAPDAKSAGGHWNPGAEAHGQWGKEHFHLGDIGNLTADASGKGTVTLTTDKWTIGTGDKSDILGHALVVHEKVDDFATQPTGNAGGRIGCAVIKK